VRLHGVAARRTVVHYGWEYGYESRQVAPGPTLPPFREPLRARAAAVAGLDAGALEQVLVARYPPGAGIGWHRDAPMFGPLVVTDGGRPHPRVGGLTRAEAKGEDGRR
jgi:alkylated DNA repair dioxygenase AlkB